MLPFAVGWIPTFEVMLWEASKTEDHEKKHGRRGPHDSDNLGTCSSSSVLLQCDHRNFGICAVDLGGHICPDKLC